MRPYRSFVSLVSEVVLGLLPIQPRSAVSAGRLTLQTNNGIAYISGGIGVHEREALIPLTADSNLQLVFTARDGNYLNKVQVRIMNMQGQTVLKTVSEGPLFFAMLPAGQYTIKATVQGQVQGACVRVPKSGQTKVNLVWDNTPLSAQAVTH